MYYVLDSLTEAGLSPIMFNYNSNTESSMYRNYFYHLHPTYLIPWLGTATCWGPLQKRDGVRGF